MFEPTPESTQRPNVAPEATTDTSYADQTVQPTPTPAVASLQPQAQTPVAAATPTPAQQHTGWFHGLMARMNQGDMVPVRDRAGNPVVDPATGQAKTQTLTGKQMGRSILAGALSALVAAEQYQPYRNGNGIWVNPSNEAVGAARQAFQAGRPQAQQAQANEQLVRQRTQQYATYKNNVDMFKWAHEIYQMKLEDKQTATAGFAPAYESAMRGEIENFDPAQGDLSEDEARQALSTMDPTSHMMVPNGKVVPTLDEHGNLTGGGDTHWMILPGQNGKITLTPGMIKAAGLPETTKVGAQIPVTQWTNLVRQASSQHIVESTVNQIAETLNLNKKFDYPPFVKKAQLTPDQLSEFQALSAERYDPVKFQAGVVALDKKTGGRVSSALADQGINTDPTEWADDQAQKLAAAKRSADPLNAPLTKEQLAGVSEDLRASHQALSADRLANLAKRITDAPTQRQYDSIMALADKEQAAAEKQSSSDTVYAFQPDKNGVMQEVEMSKQQAEDLHLPTTKIKNRIEDSQIISRLNDVNNKTDEYYSALDTFNQNRNPKDPKTETQRQLMLTAAAYHEAEEGGQSHMFGITLPIVSPETSAINKSKEAQALNSMDSDTRNLYYAWRNSEESMLGYNKVLSGGSRSSDKALKLNMAILPNPTLTLGKYDDAFRQIHSNVDIIGGKLPQLLNNRLESPTYKYHLTPSPVRQGAGNQPAAPVSAPATLPPGLFAGPANGR